MRPADETRTAPVPTAVAAAAGTAAVHVRRLSLALGPNGAPLALAAHRARFLAPPQGQRQPLTALIDEVTRAGLRGRGGAGFPTGTKMTSVAAGRGRPVVVVNGTEGEPLSYKDQLLMTTAPHLVLDGALAAATAVGASEVIVCVERHDTVAYNVLRSALAERRAAGENAAGVTLAATPPRFVAGEESALVHLLNGGEAKPTRVPPRPYQKGVRGRPTLVNNAETMAHVAQIAAFGADWFRQCGTSDDPGTALVSLSGAVTRPGVYEIPMGVTLSSVVEMAGGTAASTQAFLVGGYFGAWLPAAWAAIPLDRQSLATAGAALGCGAIVALPPTSCGWTESARVLAWMAGESAGQCGPCVHGLASIAGMAHELALGRARRDGMVDLTRWAGQVEGRGACKMPDGAIRFLRSAMNVFAADLQYHAAGQPCRAAGAPPLLPVPPPPDPWDQAAWR